MVNVGIYVRLSDEDRNKQFESDESESIQNQKAMLIDYCRERNWDVYDIYCDEDYSGIDRNRPQWKRMLADCENGKINVVLCKSQSRFSRDMEVIEKYIHNKFLEWNVRFISVVDHADNFDVSNKKARQINGLINEWYLEDASENIRRTLQNKRQRGDFTGSFAPYGYLIDPEDKNHLVIDEAAAPVVRNIFDWYLQGWGYRKIVMELNKACVPSPTLRKKQLNSKYVNKNESKSPSKGLWTHSTIYSILRNETYTGSLVQGKSRTLSYKNKKKKRVPEEQWIRVTGCHEAIIDEKTWNKTCEKLSSRARTSKITCEVTLLSGKVKCAVCGKAMKRHVYYNSAKTIKYYNLTCGSYIIGAMNCSNKSSISGLQLEQILLEQINIWIRDYCQQDKIEILTQHDITIKRLQAEADSVNQLISDKENKLLRLYEDKLDNIITKEQYLMYNQKFSDEIYDMKIRCKAIETQIEEIRQKSIDIDYQKKLIEKYTNIDTLTRGIIEEFIDTIYIGEKVEGREREVTVNWNL